MDEEPQHSPLYRFGFWYKNLYIRPHNQTFKFMSREIERFSLQIDEQFKFAAPVATGFIGLLLRFLN